MAIMRVRFTLSSLEGLPGLHTTYWNGASSTPVQADATDVAARVRAFWNSLAGQMANALVIAPVAGVDILDQTTGALVGGLNSGSLASVTGSGTGSLPSATMLLLKYGTGVIVGGRRLQGRSFIGPVSTAVNTGGNPTAASATALVTAAAFLTSGATASQLVVWHRPSVAAPAGGSVAPVTIFGTAIEFAVLRSRRD
jgi:hypothetical protein